MYSTRGSSCGITNQPRVPPFPFLSSSCRELHSKLLPDTSAAPFCQKTSKQIPKYPVWEAERALSEGHFLGNSLPAPQNPPKPGAGEGGPGCEGPTEMPWQSAPLMPGPEGQSRKEGAWRTHQPRN